MFFNYLAPADVNPWLMVNREEQRARFARDIRQYLTLENPTEGRTWVVIGTKGVGKSIFTRAVLKDLQEKISSTTLFVTVDCRRQQTWKRVLAAIARETYRELFDLQRTSIKIPSGLLETAHIVSEIATFDTAETKHVQQRLLSSTQAVHFKGTQKVLQTLSFSFNLDLKRSESDIRSLTGTIQVDEPKLTDTLHALFEDIQEAGLRTLVYLDNIDELEHDYIDQQTLPRQKHDIEGLLRLSKAPVAFVLNMRTYFSRVLRREIDDIILLKALEPTDTQKLLQVRLDKESPEIKNLFQTPEAQRTVATLMRQTPTPLSFLTWLKYITEHHTITDADTFITAQETYLETRYSSLYKQDIHAVIKAFQRPDSILTRQELLAACEASEELLHLMAELQIVLPKDYWTPNRFTLAPIMHFLHPWWNQQPTQTT